VRAFGSRLVTLSSAHDHLLRQNWKGAELHVLITDVFRHLGVDERVHLDGPELAIGPNTVTSLSMVVHELATNALKFGSLAVEGGTLALSWQIDATDEALPLLRFLWQESGGPPVTPAGRTGMGTRIVQAGLGGGGETRVEFLESGLRVALWTPLHHARTV